MKKIQILLILFFATFQFTFGQVLEGPAAAKQFPGADKVRLKPHRVLPNYVHFSPDKQLPASQFDAFLKEQFIQADPNYALIKIKEEPDQLGHTHTRYKQRYGDKPVIGSMLISHAKADKVYAVNGDFFELNNVQLDPKLTEEAALESALEFIAAEQYMWEKEERGTAVFGEKLMDKTMSATRESHFPKGELVYVPKDGDYDIADFRLAWRFDISVKKPFGRTFTFVDAASGAVISQFNLIHTADSVGTAATKYSGTQTITTDYVGPNNFRLRETGRGGGILTLNAQSSTIQGVGVDFIDTDNNWNNVNANLDEVAGDVHWAIEMSYDYFLQKHGRNSIDGNGLPLRGYVHFGPRSYNNAFYPFGSNSIYIGDGGNSPLASVDICAHELGHGLTYFSADLIYRNESGALNESFSDIFGKSIEQFAKPAAFSWVMGADLNFPIRNMQNPGAFGDPKNYFGNNWFTGSGDNGGVHFNSGVQNHWFYLLTEGGSGTNDFGDMYNVLGVGIDTASAVAFRNLTVYLTPSSGYDDARFYAIQSAIDLYGNCGKIHQQVENAWYAVGLGNPYSPNPITAFVADKTDLCELPFSINFQDKSSGVSSYLWDFGDGDTSSFRSPSHTYTAPGIYTISLQVAGVCGGNDTLNKTNYIEISAPPLSPVINMMNRVSCQGQAMLVADGLGHDEVRWYDQNGNFLAKGDTFQTSPQGQQNTFFARNIDFKPRQPVGLSDSSIGTGGNIGSDLRSLVFDVSEKTILESVKVYASGAGQRIIEYRNANGVILATRSVDIPDGESRIILDFPLEIGIDQQLGIIGTVDLFGNSSNVNYPYEIPGVLSIKGTTGSNPQRLYIMFYDWEIHSSDCRSEATSVTVQVTPIDTAIVSSVGRCGPGQAVLTASQLDSTVNWYDASGILLGTGVDFQTPYLTATTDFWAENVRYPAASLHVGPASTAIGRKGFLSDPFDTHLTFRVLQPVRLQSVWVDAASSGLRQIILSDGQGTARDTLEVTLAAGPQRVQVDFDLQPGDYRLGGTDMDLGVNSGGVTYPYVISGIVEITNSSNGLGNYYYFYDWEIQNTPCVSEFSKVTATISPGPSATFTYQNVFNTVTFTDDATGTTPTSWLWDFGDGGTSALQNPTYTYQVPGTYVVSLTTMDGNCTNTWEETLLADRNDAIQGSLENNPVQLFPNPGSGDVFISFEDQTKSLHVSVWNIVGQKLLSQSFKANTPRHLIELGDYPDGTYMVQVRHGDQVWVKKYMLRK